MWLGRHRSLTAHGVRVISCKIMFKGSLESLPLNEKEQLQCSNFSVPYFYESYMCRTGATHDKQYSMPRISFVEPDAYTSTKP